MKILINGHEFDHVNAVSAERVGPHNVRISIRNLSPEVLQRADGRNMLEIDLVGVGMVGASLIVNQVNKGAQQG